jgi:hypothetical protein
MTVESTVRRVFGAIQPVEATTDSPIPWPLQVSSAAAQLVRNRRGLYVITHVEGLEEYTTAFDTIPDLPPQPVTVTVADPHGRFFPTQLSLTLPRDPDPDNAGDPDSLFQPVIVRLYPTPNAPIFPGWALIRATVVDSGVGTSLPGVLLRVLRTSNGDTAVIGRGLTAWTGRIRGEALIPLSGLPVTTWEDENGNGNDGPPEGGPPEGGPPGGGPPGGDPPEPSDESEVIVTKIPVTVEAYYDPDFDPDGGDIPDVDDLEARRDDLPSNQVETTVRTGRETAVTIEITTS